MTVKNREAILQMKPYVPGKPIEEVKRELCIGDVIKMASNENPLGASAKAIQAMQEAVYRVHFYPDADCFALRQALAQKMHIEMENIIAGNGSDELLEILAKTYINPGDEVIIAEPTFSEYEIVTRIMDGKPVLVPLDQDGKIDLTAMLFAITAKTKMIVLCNPNNPTGAILGKEEIASFMKKVPASVMVVFDAAYAEFVDKDADFEDGQSYALQYDNAIMLRTFSKIYGLAGLRIGYGIAKKETVAMLNRVRPAFNVNLIAQAAAVAALADEEHVATYYRINQEGKRYLYQQFTAMGLAYYPSQANFILVQVGKNCQDVFQAFLRKGIIIRTGDVFGKPQAIRVSIGTMKENERFIEALKEVLA